MTPSLLRLSLLACILGAWSACPQPVPVGPGPAVADAGQPPDRFTGKTINCRLPVVAAERDDAMGDARSCLLMGDGTDAANPPVYACLVNKTSQYHPESVACVTRDLGARANAAYLAGSTDPNDKIVANEVRAWIQDHKLGFVSVEVQP